LNLFLLLGKAGFVLLFKDSPAFRYNLFAGTAVHICHVELVETSTHNKQSFDKLRTTPAKSISTAIGFE
jgi:hypothetical protein